MSGAVVGLIGLAIVHWLLARRRRFPSLAALVRALARRRRVAGPFSRHPGSPPAAVVVDASSPLSAPGMLTLRRPRSGCLSPESLEVTYAVRHLGTPLLVIGAQARRAPSPARPPLACAARAHGAALYGVPETEAVALVRQEVAQARRYYAPEVRRGELRIVGVVYDEARLELVDG